MFIMWLWKSLKPQNTFVCLFVCLSDDAISIETTVNDSVINAHGAIVGMTVCRANRSTWRKPATLSNTNPTRPDLGSNPGRFAKKPVTRPKMPGCHLQESTSNEHTETAISSHKGKRNKGGTNNNWNVRHRAPHAQLTWGQQYIGVRFGF